MELLVADGLELEVPVSDGDGVLLEVGVVLAPELDDRLGEPLEVLEGVGDMDAVTVFVDEGLSLAVEVVVEDGDGVNEVLALDVRDWLGLGLELRLGL